MGSKQSRSNRPVVTETSNDYNPEDPTTWPEDALSFSDTNVPNEIIQLFQQLKDIKGDWKTHMHPKTEVLLWGFDHAIKEPILWPSPLPDLHSAVAVERQSGWSIFLDYEFRDRVEEQMGMMKPVLINGKKMSLSQRTPFAGEHHWMGDCPSKKFLEETYGPPILVVRGLNVWADVIGADSPSIVLYSDGTLIRGDKKMNDVTLKSLGIENLVESIENQHFSLSNWTDQPSSTVWYWNEGKEKKVSIYGDLFEFIRWKESKERTK
ncbi:hypothetical protein PROFUN_03735 [Planoprotostelium fungivorum]|uniref:Uncharacterized protein n=1 Tax=Planoprotostelium fungivorum TaxID=1890364 RepID=A0A2P6NDP0_9EUKA|nr:hypothetical protein PROFUN_03735 [Planoprotostelium fungivorum]